MTIIVRHEQTQAPASYAEGLVAPDHGNEVPTTLENYYPFDPAPTTITPVEYRENEPGRTENLREERIRNKLGEIANILYGIGPDYQLYGVEEAGKKSATERATAESMLAETGHMVESKPKLTTFEDVIEAVEAFDENPYGFRKVCPDIINTCTSWIEQHKNNLDTNPIEVLEVIGYKYAATLQLLTGGTAARLSSTPKGGDETVAETLKEVLDEGKEAYRKILENNENILPDPQAYHNTNPDDPFSSTNSLLGEKNPTVTSATNRTLVRSQPTEIQSDTAKGIRVKPPKNDIMLESFDIISKYLAAQKEIDTLLKDMGEHEPIKRTHDKTTIGTSPWEISQQAKEIMSDTGQPEGRATEIVIAQRFPDASEQELDEIKKIALGVSSSGRTKYPNITPSKNISPNDPLARY